MTGPKDYFSDVESFRSYKERVTELLKTTEGLLTASQLAYALRGVKRVDYWGCSKADIRHSLVMCEYGPVDLDHLRQALVAALTRQLDIKKRKYNKAIEALKWGKGANDDS